MEELIEKEISKQKEIMLNCGKEHMRIQNEMKEIFDDQFKEGSAEKYFKLIDQDKQRIEKYWKASKKHNDLLITQRVVWELNK